MNIKYAKSLPIYPCKSFYNLRTQEITDQEKFLLNFIKDNNINDSIRIVNHVPAIVKHHNMIIFIQKDPIDIDVFIDQVKQLSLLATKYFHVAVNKFCLSSSVDRDIDSSNTDYDQKIINLIEKSVGKDVIYRHWDSNDSGALGNFEFPITQILFKHAQIPSQAI